MKSIFNNKKGFTLVEVVTSLAILGFIIVAFTSLFGMGISNIFSSGNEDMAMSHASKLMELVYREQERKEGLISDDIIDVLESAGANVFEKNDLYANSSGNEIRFSLKESSYSLNSFNFSDGYEVTIVVLYHNGERYASLTSYVRGRDNND